MVTGNSFHAPRIGFSPSTLGRFVRLLVRVTAMALVLVCVGRGTARAEVKIAIIDLRRAMTETERGLRVQARLKQLFDAKQIELDDKQKALQQGKADLEKDAKSGKTSKGELQKKYDSLQQQAMDFEKLAVDYQREMQRQDSELSTPIVQGLMALVRRVASQNAYDVVIDKQAAHYFRSDLDITDRIIQLYNAEEGVPGEGKEPAGRAPKGDSKKGQPDPKKAPPNPKKAPPAPKKP
jgi:outer membrane protein